MKVILPKIPAGLREVASHPSVLAPEEHVERTIVRGFESFTLAAQKMTFDETALDRLQLVNAALDGVKMLDVEVRGCDLSAAVLIAGTANRVRFTSCRLAGTDFSRTRLKNVTFVGCKLNMANFRFARLERVSFEDCELQETDFQAAELIDVIFRGCIIENAIFSQAKLLNVDARSCEVRNLRGWRSLRNLTIDHVQLATVAPELARELGIAVQS